MVKVYLMGVLLSSESVALALRLYTMEIFFLYSHTYSTSFSSNSLSVPSTQIEKGKDNDWVGFFPYLTWSVDSAIHNLGEDRARVKVCLPVCYFCFHFMIICIFPYLPVLKSIASA